MQDMSDVAEAIELMVLTPMSLGFALGSLFMDKV